MSTGNLSYEKNIEILWGRIVERPPIGPPHEDRTDCISKWSIRVTLDEPIRVRTQNSIRLPVCETAPQPDICWVRERDYSKRAPHPEDILLIIEVADSSLEADRKLKLSAYAESGVQDYWIVNLRDQEVEVYRKPSGAEYEEQTICRNVQQISPLALTSVKVSAEVLLGIADG